MSLRILTTTDSAMSRRPNLTRAFGRLLAVLPLAAAGAALAPAAGHAAVTATSAQPVFSDTLVFSRYHHVPDLKYLTDGTTIPWPETVPVDTGVINVKNTGASAIEVTGASIANPSSFQVVAPTSFPVTLAAGATLPVQVKFTYNTNATSPNHALITSTITINTTDGTNPSRTLKLRGWWQTRPEGGTEPSLRDLMSIYGFTTAIPTPYQLQQHGAKTAPIGPEVVSAYWKRFDPSKPVRVVQLLAAHGSGKTESLFWGSKSSPRFIAKHGAKAAQTVLPTLDPANTGPLDITRTPTAEPFSFGVGGEWSDWKVNSKVIDQNNKYSICTPSEQEPCGQHMRFWPAQDQSGAVMPGSYIMAMDYGSSSAVNWDFQDNVYLIQNIMPGAGTTPPVSDTPLELQDPGTMLYRVDAGAPAGSQYTDAYGRKWISDKNLPNGGSFAPSSAPDENPNANNILGTAEDGLFRSYRGQVGVSKPFTYTLPTGNATKIALRLYFAERFWAEPAKRIFNVYVNGQLYLDNVDIWGRAGGTDRAYVISDSDIPVSGTLTIRFQATVNNPSIAAFEVFDTSSGVAPTPAPTPVPTPVPTPAATPAATPVQTATPAPTAAPVPTATAAPTATPVPTVPPVPTLPPGVTPAPTPTAGPQVFFGIQPRVSGTRTVETSCRLPAISVVVSGRSCRLRITRGPGTSGTELGLKRVSFGTSKSAKFAVQLSTANWAKFTSSGATFEIRLLAPDGKTTISKTQAYYKPSAAAARKASKSKAKKAKTSSARR